MFLLLRMLNGYVANHKIPRRQTRPARLRMQITVLPQRVNLLSEDVPMSLRPHVGSAESQPKGRATEGRTSLPESWQRMTHPIRRMIPTTATWSVKVAALDDRKCSAQNPKQSRFFVRGARDLRLGAGRSFLGDAMRLRFWMWIPKPCLPLISR
jgi:hypothetical protein